MSVINKDQLATELSARAEILSALGDATRLSLVARLCNGQPQSITELTKGSEITRQAVTKHLRVLESAGIVHSVKSGRESHYIFNPQPIKDIGEYLNIVSAQWDDALARLKAFVEE